MAEDSPIQEATPTSDPEPGESRYSLADCMAASMAAFGVRPEVVKAAFAHARLTEGTRSEIEQAIKITLALEV